MLLVCKPIGRSGVLCCVPFRFAHEAPKTKEHLFRLGMDGAAFTRLCLITRANLDDETAPAAALDEQGQSEQSRAEQEQPTQELVGAGGAEFTKHGVWTGATGPLPRPSVHPTHPRVIINNSAYDSYPTARIARMMASAADPDLSTWSVPAQDKHQPGRATALYR